MANQLRTFTGGLDTDTAPHLMEKDSYSSAMNVHVALNGVNGPDDGFTNFTNDRGVEGIVNTIAGNIPFTDGLNDAIHNAYGSYNSEFTTCIGNAVDESTSLSQQRSIYLFLRQGNGSISDVDTRQSYIVRVNIEYNGEINVPRSYDILLLGDMVAEPNPQGDGLNFGLDANLTARVLDNMLIYTDGVNPVRYLDLNKDYFSYTQPIPQNIITLATEPPVVPLTASRRYVDAGGTYIYTGDPTSSRIVQKLNYQFTYRTTNIGNLTSVLSPYTFTVTAVRQQDLDVDAFFGNRITVIVPKEQSFLEDVKSIDIVARDLAANKFDTIYQWNIEDTSIKYYSLFGVSYTDAQAIAAHNDILNPFQLYVNGWDGTNILETINDASAAKSFDNVPLTSQALELTSNRLFLGNNKEGYNTPNSVPAISAIDIVTYKFNNAPTVHPNTFVAYAISIGDNIPATKYAYCLFLRDTTTNTNYAFPKSFIVYGVTTQNNFSGSILGSIWLNDTVRNLPQSLAFNQLIKLNEQGDPTIVGSGVPGTTSGIVRNRIMNEINPLFSSFTTLVTFPNNNIWIYYDDAATQTFNTVIYNDANYLGPSSQSNAFLPGASYNIGIQYYDDLLRKSGVKKITSFPIPRYDPLSQNLIERASFFMPSGTQSNDVIPDWAKYYSISMSKNTSASNFVSFSPTALTFAYKTPLGQIVYNQSEVSTNYKYYGLAIPLSTLSAYGVGYTYAEGDLCQLSIYDHATFGFQFFTAPVLTSQDGYAIVLIDKDSVFNYVSYICNTIQLLNPSGTPFVAPVVNILQADFYVTLYSSQVSSNELYEVSAFGPIVNPGVTPEFGNFYPNYFFGNTLECQMIGDTYTQARNGCGPMVGTSINTFEKGINYWATNLGRITPIDLIGQKNLTNAIRWSNVKIPNSNQNGLSTFDPLDTKDVDSTAGPITSIIVSTKDANLGSRMLILARANSYISLIGQQQIYGQDQQTAFVAAADVLGSITPITGQWGCISPKSVVAYKGLVFWADALNREIIQFSGDSATPISQIKAGFLWNQVFRDLPYRRDDGVYIYDNYAGLIKSGINPYTFELFVTCPTIYREEKYYGADCGIDRINQYIVNQKVSYVYNFKINKWQGAYQQCPDEWIRLGDDLYTIGAMYTNSLKFLLEFNSTSISYNQFDVTSSVVKEFYITTPMNQAYPQVIEPMSLSVLDASIISDVIVYEINTAKGTYGQSGISSYGQIARTMASAFQYREGEWIMPIFRNRFSNNGGAAQVTSIIPFAPNFGGSGYSSTTPPLVTIQPPLFGGTTATATAVVVGGAVTSYIITNPGTGYTSQPAVTVAPPISGTTATAYANWGGSVNSFDQSGITGDRLRVKTPFIQLNFVEESDQLNIQALKLEYKVSTGH
jgi:hypothetical protein